MFLSSLNMPGRIIAVVIEYERFKSKRSFDIKLPHTALFTSFWMSELCVIKNTTKIMTHSTSVVLAHSTGTFSKSKAFILLAHIARVLLGLIFLLFGLNGLLHFIPMPPPTGTAAEFVYGLVKANYFLPLMATVQLICGVLLLSGTIVPFALLLLFPITLNIFLFHLTLDPTGLGMAILILAANVLLAIYYWPVYQPLFKHGNAWKSKKIKNNLSKLNNAWLIL